MCLKMTLKKSKILQELCSKAGKFKKSRKDVEFILLYGSFARGKAEARDIDIAIIVNKKKGLNEKLKLAQEFKEILAFSEKIDVKAVDFYDMRDENFLARQGILAEGYSLTHKAYLSELFGLKSFVIFSFSLENLTESKKKMFLYALNGRRGSEGLLKTKKIERLGKGALKIPLEFSEEIKEFFDSFKINYSYFNAVCSS